MTPNDAMKFTGNLSLGKVEAPKQKQADYSGPDRIEGGYVELRFTIPRPEAPMPPRKPDQLNENSYEYRQMKADHPGELEAPTQGEDETEKAFTARVKKLTKAHDDQLAEFERFTVWLEEGRAEYNAAVARHNKKLEGLNAALFAYAKLPGLAAVAGGLDYEVTLRPTAHGRSMLPGFIERPWARRCSWRRPRNRPCASLARARRRRSPTGLQRETAKAGVLSWVILVAVLWLGLSSVYMLRN